MSAWTDLVGELQAIGMWDAISEAEANTEEGAALLVLAILQNLDDATKANLITMAQAWVDSTPSQNPRVVAVREWLAANT